MDTPTPDPGSLSPAARACEQRARALYGPAFSHRPGLLHVFSAVERAGWLHPLRIRPGVPRSDTDAFCLRLARARADAIVTTGRCLREEPRVTHRFDGPRGGGADAWRREVLGRKEPPHSAVLTSGAALDFRHPLFHAGAPCLVFTRMEAVPRLASAARRAGVELVGVPEPDLAALLALLRTRGLETVSVEAGPCTARALYERGPLPDEVLVSRFLGFEEPAGRPPPEPLLAPPLLPRTRLEALYPIAAGTEVREPSGPWRFERRLRSEAGTPSP